jgi:ATP-binding cassette subfamily G (WHITE) protein 2 (SNQ2)
MSNEFAGLIIQCQPPFLVPQGPGAAPQFQSCTLQGSQPGRTTVDGADYIRVAYNYSRSHLWRNFGFICAFFIFFVALTALGMELQKPNKGGGSVTIYKRGQVPKSVEEAIEAGSESNDVEKNKSIDGANGVSLNDSEKSKDESSGSETGDEKTGVAKNETIFTWQNVNYTIPYEGQERQLLKDVQGFVRPGKLTALMGASGTSLTPESMDISQLLTIVCL